MITEIEQVEDVRKQKGIPQIIFTILSFICFLWVYNIMVINEIEPHYIAGLVYLIPTIIFAVLTFCVRKNLMNVCIADILMILISSISVFLTFVSIIFLAFSSSGDIVTDITKYDRVLKVISYREHFPENIPQRAAESKIYYTPQLLQGAEQCFIKFDIDSEFIDTEIQKVSKKYQWRGYISSNYCEESESELYGLFYEPFSQIGYKNLEYEELEYTENYDIKKDEKNLEVYVIDSKPYKEDNWNHGYTYGIAVDRVESSIIYFEKVW